jgi:hypothetical protein
LVETKANESVRIYFGKRIEAGLGRIKLEYSGSLNENSQGFYKTGCINRDLSRGYAAVTQFEVFFGVFHQRIFLFQNVYRLQIAELCTKSVSVFR